MDDKRLIHDNLAALGRSGAQDRPWIHRWYILAYCFAPALLVLLTSRYADDASALVLTGQFALAAGTYAALHALKHRPLLNPVQAIVLLFHWWFAIGPGIAVIFAVHRGDHDLLSQYVASGGEALWTVAFGLPWYAFCANQTILLSRGVIRPAAFLQPEGILYRPRTILAYWMFGGLMSLAVAGFSRMGFAGNQAVNYLGGTVSENWFVSLLQALSAVALFATIGVMGYLAGPVKERSRPFALIAIGAILLNAITAFVSGWKGAVVISFVLLFILMLVWRQKAPIAAFLVLAVFYLALLEPVVTQMRFAAEAARITTPEERTELFKLAISNGIAMEDLQEKEINIESPFRYIYGYAGRIAAESSLFDGPWSGTLSNGLAVLVPRALYPDKPDSNMGNYIAQQIEAVGLDDYTTNIGVSIPFEFTGNYGHLAGILSFGLIGVLWTMLCVWLLSEDRLATHPLSPLLIVYSLGMEASAGQFLAKLRDLPIVLGAAYLLWVLLKKRL